MRPTDELPILFADRVQSLNYDGPTPPSIFADAGTSIDLATGTITSTGLVVDGVTGDLSVRGDITASELVILDQTGLAEAARFFTTPPGSLFALDTGFAFAFPSVEADRTRGVAGGATGALGVDTVGINGTVAKFSSQVSSWSELALAEDYQYGTAEVYGYSDIDTGYAEATLFAEASLGAPSGSGALAQSSVKVIAVPEGYVATPVPYSIEVQGTMRVRSGFNDTLRATPSELLVSSGSAEVRIGEWSSGSTYSAIEGAAGYLLLGRGSVGVNDSIFLRAAGTGSVNIGTNGSNDLVIANGGDVTVVDAFTAGGLITGATVRVDDGTVSVPAVRFTSDANCGMYRATTDRVGIAAAGVAACLIESGNFWARGVWFTATASTVEVRAIDSSGRLGYFSSSIDTKREVEPIEVERAVGIIDALAPVWYRSACEVDRPDWSHYGLIAEAVADIDPRLVGFDDDGKPMTVAYTSIVVPLVAYVQQLAARLAALESAA